MLTADYLPDEDFSPSFRSNLPCWCLSDEETIAETEKIMQEIEEEGIQILLASVIALLRLLLDMRTLRGYSFATPAEERSLTDILLLRERVTTFKQQVDRLQGLLVTPFEESFPDFLFDDRLSRLHQLGPVRKINRLDFPQALCCLEKVSSQWEEIIRIAEWLNSGTRSLDDVLSYCIHVSSSSSHHLLARSLLLIVLLHAVNNLPTMILQSMEFHAVPEKISTADPTCCEWVSTGSPRVAVWELLKALMVCRRRLFHRLENILILWGQVMSEALYLDEQLRSKVAVSPIDKETVQPWYSSWAVLFVCKAMDLYMSVMLEADILHPAELDYFFWYWDYIHSVHSHASDRLGSMRYQYDTNSKKIEPRREKKEKNVKEVQRIEDRCAEEFMLKGRGLLCKGIFRTIVLLKRLRAVDSNCSDYTLRSNVFLRRFKPFQEVLNPGPLNFEDFLKTVGGSEEDTFLNNDQRKVELEALLDSSLLCFKHARSYFEEARKSNNGSNRDNLLIADMTSSLSDSVLLIKASYCIVIVFIIDFFIFVCH